MHQSHVVILESRRFPDITEQWYNVAVNALTQQGITHSRVTVPNSADLPIALRILLEIIHHSNDPNVRVPDGYLILGLNCDGDIAQENHHSIWDAILNLTTQAGVPASSVIVFEKEGQDLNHSATRYISKIQLSIQSLVNLMMLRHQLSGSPLTAAA
ncbi:MAG: 6,7-dimethyl-8-ribityllumazine synthase [Pseudomonadota bacterium]|jgi:6,7-dimethyl-8-ribityllumazine synthase|nr:6,7-dimethyl-8-ribityllumazine synthase [Alphaproteobacteria bacterium]